MKFKGFSDWIEIFKGGKQTDSQGVEHDADELIKKAVETFDPEFHEPPMVAGHPKDNAPAYGWVSGLKKQGGKLFAKFKDVVPEFEEIVKTGMYKKRSASFYPDGRLRHVGFLGAATPAVKGLKDLAFNDNTNDSEIIFDFSEKEKKGASMKFSDFLEVFKFWKEAEGNPDVNMPDVKSQGDNIKTFSEADIEAAKLAGADAERKKADAEFTEKERVSRQEAHTKAIADFCESLSKEGKIPPSWIDAGLVEFAKGLDSDIEISFTEKGDKKSSAAWLKDFLIGLEKSAIFQEMATKERAGDSADFTEDKRVQEVGESIAAKVN